MSSPQAQSWNPEQYASNARFVSDLGVPLIELLAPQPGERILDLGCGDGALSARLVDAGCEVVGVDASEEMVAAARARGLNAVVVDARELQFEAQFDAVFSNAALHWMAELRRVIAGVWRALKPSGRFVGEFGGRGNIAAIVKAVQAALLARGHVIESPWFFPGPEEYRRLLETCTFAVDFIQLFHRPTPLPGEMAAWLETFAHPFLSAVPAGERPALIDEIVESLRGDLCDENGKWWADYVRLRFSARKATRAI
jgi:trans-aconitate methyltransferase